MKMRWLGMHLTIKDCLNAISMLLVLPCAVCCWVGDKFTRDAESMFLFWAHVFSVLPGKTGMFLRRAYYRLTLDRCASNFYIGFGALFTHRHVIVEKNAYIGAYALVGSVHLGEGCLIGSRASLVSGTKLHVLDEQGRWGPCDKTRLRQIKVGDYAWIGEGAIVMANIGPGTMVAAGAVVEDDARGGILLAGNPSRFVKKLTDKPSGTVSRRA
jgi:virginiamycin A acetyltransferase